jgi:hypothetical protein
VGQAGRNAGFLPHARPPFRVGPGPGAIAFNVRDGQARIVGEIDDPHATAADLVADDTSPSVRPASDSGGRPPADRRSTACRRDEIRRPFVGVQERGDLSPHRGLSPHAWSRNAAR